MFRRNYISLCRSNGVRGNRSCLIAHALKKHVLLLTNDPDDVPFDLEHCRHLVYEKLKSKFKKELNNFRGKLTAELKWILCADLADVRRKSDAVTANWKFLKERNFSTRYCSPQDVQRATGEPQPRWDAVEDLGDYL